MFGSNNQKPKVHCGEVYAIWEYLTKRYVVREFTDICQMFASDADFKALLGIGVKLLDMQIEQTEKQMENYGIPLPTRPPKSTNIPANTEIFRDELMFNLVHMGISNFTSSQAETFVRMTNPKLKKMFQDFSAKEVDLQDKMLKYASLKGWMFMPPAYSQSQHV